MAILRNLALAAVAAAGVGWWITSPSGADRALPDDGNAEAGALVFAAAGCGSCHAAPEAEGENKLILAGGERFNTPFGTLVAPNISSHPEQGIGGWNATQFADAVLAGTSPEGHHYYPAFPYAAYTLMTERDVADLWAYMQTLPASEAASQPHDMAFPFNIRRGIGVWKLLYMPDGYELDPKGNVTLARGAYLVEALAHCAECHTARDPMGGLDRAAWLAGAPNPTGRGRIPSLTPDDLTWNETDIAYYLETGFTPDFDSAGGHMARVVENMAKLPPEDRAAIAMYLKALPASE